MCSSKCGGDCTSCKKDSRGVGTIVFSITDAPQKGVRNRGTRRKRAVSDTHAYDMAGSFVVSFLGSPPGVSYAPHSMFG